MELLSGMFAKAGFWVGLAFFIFIFAIYGIAKKALINLLDDRIKSASEEIDEVADLLKLAKTKLVAAKKLEKDAVSESESIMDNANKESALIIEEAKIAADKMLGKRIEICMKRIEQEEMRMIKELKSNIVLSATEIAKEKIATTLNQKSSTILIQKDLKNLSI